MLTVALVIGLSNTESGAASDSLPASTAPVLQGGDARATTFNGGARLRVTRPRCASAKRAVAYYRARYVEWTVKRGAVPVLHRSSLSACPRYAVRVLRAKARAARQAYLRFWEYHYHWQAWLPEKWARIGACETGYGKRPGNWRHSNSSYEGAFGFALSSWDAFVPRADPKAGPYPANAYLATPRQQYEVALAIWRMYGLSGWGCRNA